MDSERCGEGGAPPRMSVARRTVETAGGRAEAMPAARPSATLSNPTICRAGRRVVKLVGEAWQP